MNKKIRMFAKGMFLLLASVTSTATMATGVPTTSGGGKAMAVAEESSTATGMPEDGKTYYIYCDNATQQFFYNNGGDQRSLALHLHLYGDGRGKVSVPKRQQ